MTSNHLTDFAVANDPTFKFIGPVSIASVGGTNPAAHSAAFGIIESFQTLTGPMIGAGLAGGIVAAAAHAFHLGEMASPTGIAAIGGGIVQYLKGGRGK